MDSEVAAAWIAAAAGGAALISAGVTAFFAGRSNSRNLKLTLREQHQQWLREQKAELYRDTLAFAHSARSALVEGIRREHFSGSTNEEAINAALAEYRPAQWFPLQSGLELFATPAVWQSFRDVMDAVSALRRAFEAVGALDMGAPNIEKGNRVRLNSADKWSEMDKAIDRLVAAVHLDIRMRQAESPIS